MQRLHTLFTEHPNTVGESYSGHFMVASSFAVVFFKLALISLVHAVFPWIFERTASATIERLYKDMCVNRSGLSQREEA